ncbi:DUF1877 family protein [Streptomyces sp. AM8-1-1]|uniref:DUF1877 family protein n=1 Tax=Streptomyces sp. AM8-1-1 TaxID=3075825 RepID=UPI0028C3FB7E|nr:DUF1877 family protein [Streptomyces sp. AM8-1-1]WNO76803.1 DUF1877 family protein [Streptomyces sp. AM8-1-1]
MALTQRLARVSPQYLDWCRDAAAAALDGDPHWDPPEEDTLDLDWAVWELLAFYRRMQPDSRHISILERSIAGDVNDPVAFLDHPEFYDGFDGPPSLLAPGAVAEVAHSLAAMKIDSLLRVLPAYREAGGFSAFHGDPGAYLAGHFALLQNFYGIASQQGLAVVVWVD